ISVGYTPWLRSLLPDINFGYTDGYYKMNDREALSYSLRNIDYNTMSFTNIVGNAADEFHPRETAVDLAYGRKLASNFSMALAFRYIYSDLTNGKTVNGRSSHPGQSMAIDISAYYKKDFNIAGREFARAFGLNVSNIGSKISYYDLQSKLFLPTSLRLGGRLSVAIGEKNFFSVTTDLNKLLIPEPHIYSTLPAGTYGNTDFREELKQTTIGTGIEFVFNHCFFLRSGYFYEDARYGGRQYFTAGIGVRYKRFALDLSDLLPTGIRSPLKNTARFSFTCSLPVITKEYIDHQQ
ncbi:MAG TPA: type IX secretion system outer membrane channel protein PorV, partial [Bacteroidia bacterium]